MNESIQRNVEEIDRELSPSWTSLSEEVRQLAADLKIKAASTDLAGETEHLSQQVSRLCAHVARLHADVTDLIENVETRLPLLEAGEYGNEAVPADVSAGDVEREKMQIQRESHELRDDFLDVVKALFMWKDDPVERARDKH